jgi:hypothetical protein
MMMMMMMMISREKSGPGIEPGSKKAASSSGTMNHGSCMFPMNMFSKIHTFP